MTGLCLNCVKHKALKRLINEKGKQIQECLTCKSQYTKFMDKSNHDLKQLFKALIRYFYCELVDYRRNGNGNGTEFTDLFVKENEILNNSISGLEEIIKLLVDPSFEGNNTKNINLYSNDNKPPKLIYAPFKKSLKDSKSNLYYELTRDLRSQNYFTIDKKYHDLLNQYKDKLDKTIKPHESYYRARIGYTDRFMPNDINTFSNQHYEPFRDKDISAPPPSMASAGRMNRDGVSFLYLASNPETAIAEIRPHPGHIVSIGKFIPKKELNIADFTSLDIYDFYANPQLLDDFHFLKSIDLQFSMPVPPDQKHQYMVPQFIADKLREIDYDGIMFQSSIGDGVNLTVFDQDNFKYIPDDAKVLKVKKVKYETDDLGLVPSDKSNFTALPKDHS